MKSFVVCTFSQNILRVMKLRKTRFGRECITNMKNINASRILVVKRKGKRPPGSCRFVYEYNIKKDVVGAVWGNVDCIRLAQNSNN
jgi:hypothetical protein